MAAAVLPWQTPVSPRRVQRAKESVSAVAAAVPLRTLAFPQPVQAAVPVLVLVLVQAAAPSVMGLLEERLSLTAVALPRPQRASPRPVARPAEGVRVPSRLCRDP